MIIKPSYIAVGTLLLLSACSTPQPVIMYPTLPDSITSPCSMPVSDIKTNGDLLNYTVELKGDLSECSTKQKALVDAIGGTNHTSVSISVQQGKTVKKP